MKLTYCFCHSPQSEVNQDILSKIKKVLKKEHGGENCPWTDLQMEGLLLYESTLINKQLMNEPEYLMNKCGDRGGCYRPITPSEISIILHMI